MTESIVFDRAADSYDQTRGFPPGEEQRIAWMIAHKGGLSASSRLLELGVGTGRVALPLAAHVGSVFGVDLSLPMMNRLVAKRTSERVLLSQADITRLPFPARAFDAALAVHVFHLVPRWEDAVAEVARVLRPGGRLLNGWTENLHRESWWKAWNSVLPDYKRDGGGVQFERSGTFLLDVGWRMDGEPVAYPYAQRYSPNQFLDGLRQRLWSSLWRLSDDVLEKSIAAVREVLLSEHGDLDESLDLTTTLHVGAYIPPNH